MYRIIKGQPTKIEYGEYGNFETMIPIEILEYHPDEYYGIFIRWQRPNSDYTIDLWSHDDKDINFKSFGLIEV